MEERDSKEFLHEFVRTPSLQRENFLLKRGRRELHKKEQKLQTLLYTLHSACKSRDRETPRKNLKKTKQPDFGLV